MADIKAQIILHTVDALPENFVSNTLSFSGSTNDSDITQLSLAIQTFYNALNEWWSPALAQNGHEMKFTDRAAPAPQFPFRELNWNLSSVPSGQPLPREVALVNSFQAARESGVAQARRRGRIYMGPLDTSANSSSGDPAATLVTALVNASSQFRTDVDAIVGIEGDFEWQVWSTVNGSGSAVDNGWVDNAWDVQRSRGRDALTRSTWPA